MIKRNPTSAEESPPPGQPCPELRVERPHLASEGLSATGWRVANASISRLNSSSSYYNEKELELAETGVAEPRPLRGPAIIAPSLYTTGLWRPEPLKSDFLSLHLGREQHWVC